MGWVVVKVTLHKSLDGHRESRLDSMHTDLFDLFRFGLYDLIHIEWLRHHYKTVVPI